MKRLQNFVQSFAIVSTLLVLFNSTVFAQEGPNRRLFGTIASPQLAKLDEVSKELKLTDEQKKQVDSMIEKMTAKFGQIFQDAAGDFEKVGKEIRKSQTEAHRDLLAALDDTQKKRMQEIYVQINNGSALMDDTVVAALKISDDQKKKIEQAQQDSMQSMFASFGDWQNMSEKERAKKAEELVSARDKAMLAPLSDEQKSEFEKSKGEKIDVDLSKIPMPGQ